MSEAVKARVGIVLSMATIGTIGLLAKNIALPASMYAFCRAALAACVIGVFLIITKQRIDFKGLKKEMLLFIISGAFLGMNWSFLFEAYQNIPYAVATLCDYFAPVVVMAISPVVYKERLSAKQIICFAMATVGLMLLVGVFGGGGGNLTAYGIIMGICAMLCYVPVMIINKLIKSVGGIQRTFLQFLSAAAVLAVVSAVKGEMSLAALDTAGALSMLVVGVLHTGIAYCLYFSALPKLSGQEGAILSYVDPLTAVLVSVVFLREPLSALQLLGGVLLMGFTLGNEISGKGHGKKKSGKGEIS